MCDWKIYSEDSGNSLSWLVCKDCKVCGIAIALWCSEIKSGCNQSANKIQSSKLEPFISSRVSQPHTSQYITAPLVLTSALEGSSWQDRLHFRVNYGDSFLIRHLIGGRLCPRVGQDAVENPVLTGSKLSFQHACRHYTKCAIQTPVI
jgi:hypothetical protein